MSLKSPQYVITALPSKSIANLRAWLGTDLRVCKTEEALGAMRQSGPHEFRYRQRLLDIDLVPRVFYVGPTVTPTYRVVYIIIIRSSY